MFVNPSWGEKKIKNKSTNLPLTSQCRKAAATGFSNTEGHQVLGSQNVHQHASCSREISHISETFFSPKQMQVFCYSLRGIIEWLFFFWFIDIQVSSSKLWLQQFFRDYRHLATKLQFHANLQQHGLFWNPGSCSSCQGQIMPYTGVLATGIHMRSYYCNRLNRAPEADCSSQSKLGHLQ